MPKIRRLVCLDQFRRKKPDAPQHADGAATPPKQMMAVPAEPATPALHPRTDRRVTAALAAIEKLKCVELTAIAVTEAPKQYRVRFSAAAVAREAGIGRTQVYEGNTVIREAVEAARTAIENALEARRTVRRPASKQAWAEKVAALQARHEAEIRRIASQQMSDLIQRLGPSIEAALRGTNEMKVIEGKVRHLESQLVGHAAVTDVLRKALEEMQGKAR